MQFEKSSNTDNSATIRNNRNYCRLGVGDNQSDSIQCLNFAKK